MRLAGRVALVTGGGRRLGKAISQALGEAGCRLVLHYRHSADAARATAGELAALECEAFCARADLSSPEEIDSLFAEVEERFGRLDVLVNSAASFDKQPLIEIEPADWDRVLAVNLRAPYLCIRRASPLLRASPREDDAPAAVINVADLSGVSAWPGYAHHGASKAGLLQLTDVAARELAPEIRVNAIVPGPILPAPGQSDESEEWQALVQLVPAGRGGRPEEVGAAVVFLARNDFIFGERIFVDGGEHLLGAGHRAL